VSAHLSEKTVLERGGGESNPLLAYQEERETASVIKRRKEEGG